MIALRFTHLSLFLSPCPPFLHITPAFLVSFSTTTFPVSWLPRARSLILNYLMFDVIIIFVVETRRLPPKQQKAGERERTRTLTAATRTTIAEEFDYLLTKSKGFFPCLLMEFFSSAAPLDYPRLIADHISSD